MLFAFLSSPPYGSTLSLFCSYSAEILWLGGTDLAPQDQMLAEPMAWTIIITFLLETTIGSGLVT